MGATRNATPINICSEERVTVPSGGYEAGLVLQAPSGRAGYIAGNRDLAEGEAATIITRGRIQVPALATLVGSPSGGAPVKVDWDDTAKQIVATTAGDFSLGILAKDKANGETTAEVILNDPGLS